MVTIVIPLYICCDYNFTKNHSHSKLGIAFVSLRSILYDVKKLSWLSVVKNEISEQPSRVVCLRYISITAERQPYGGAVGQHACKHKRPAVIKQTNVRTFLVCLSLSSGTRPPLVARRRNRSVSKWVSSANICHVFFFQFD